MYHLSFRLSRLSLWNCPRALCHSNSANRSRTLSCAVVGSGPAGFYVTQSLFKQEKSWNVDIYERLPVPFGLVRYGVAPDHPEVKNVINSFMTLGNGDRFRFFGNVQIGDNKDITLAELRSAYDAVVLCYGAQKERKLNIPGETLGNIWTARQFVDWYNGMPNTNSNATNPNLVSSDTAVIIGNGNVALDIARVLLSRYETLAETDISKRSLEALKDSGIRKVHIIGRRGPAHASFTTGELRELLSMGGIDSTFNSRDFIGITDETLEKFPRPRRRLLQLMLRHMSKPSATIQNQSNMKCLNFDFFANPTQFVADDKGNVSAVELARMRYPNGENDVFVPTSGVVNDTATPLTRLGAGLVVTSIGYSGAVIDTLIPMDPRRGTILNDGAGRVEGLSGVYCAGWIASGPTGVIADTLAHSKIVAKAIAEDVASASLKSQQDTKHTLVNRLVASGKVVDWKGWLRIDAAEREKCHKPKPREKIVDVVEMLAVAASNDSKSPPPSKLT